MLPYHHDMHEKYTSTCTTLLKITLNFYILLIFHVQDNVFIISNPKSKYPVLQLDLRFTFSSCLFLFLFLFQVALRVQVTLRTTQTAYPFWFSVFADWYQILWLSLSLQHVAALPLLVLDNRFDHKLFFWGFIFPP